MSIPTVAVTCTAYDQNGNAVAGGTFRARLNSTEIYNGFVVPEQVTGVADASGVCVLQLWPNALGVAGSAYRITAINPDTGQKYLDTTAVVPNSACNLHQIIVAAPYPTVDASQQALVAAQGALAAVTAQAGIATTKAAEASASATTAATQAGIATTQAGTATTQAGIATIQATTATTQADIAAIQAGIATTKASEASASAATATTQAGTATTKASEAAASAATATTQAGTATTQAGVATTKASEAAASATNASNSAYTAGLSVDAAVTAKNQAVSSASAAASSATAASGSATAASTSASSASASASTATTQAGTATTQAGLATTAATTATSKASEASTYASNASASANTSTTQAGVATTQAGIATTQAGVATTQAGIAIANANAALSVYGSVTAQQASVTAAQNAATSATASAAAANTSAGNASGSAASALAIYGTAAAQQTALTNAQSAASLAQGYALSASSAIQQDLSGVTAQALHRSPNAVTAMFVYDTSKDSDGGAWTEKCQHTSWYNEALNGKWLGAQASEVNARYAGATLGSELVANGTFNSNITGVTTSGSTGTGTVTWNPVGAMDLVAGSSGTANADLTALTTVSGTTYALNIVTLVNPSGTVGVYVGTTLGNNNILNATIAASATGTSTFYFTATGTTTYVRLNKATANVTATIDSVSIKPITALTTASGDYYQNAVDGKFYRLWKNLLKHSADFSNTLWSKNNGATVAAQGNAWRITDPGDTASHISQSLSGLPSNGQYSFQIDFERQASGIFVVGLQNFWCYVNHATLTTLNETYYQGNNVSSSCVVLSGTRCRLTVTLNHVAPNTFAIYPALGQMGGDVNATVARTATGYLDVYSAQLEYGSTATAYEAKTTDGPVSETFRGNKADFPRLAGIVAEAASVTIYDLTEAGRPMWMRFVRGDFNNLIFSFDGGLSAKEGIFCATSNSGNTNYVGLMVVRFALDDIVGLRNSSYPNNHNSVGAVSLRNGPWPQAGSRGLITFGGGLVSALANAVAMTVLPDAPVDAVTGLQVPTIAVATASGVSVIKHNGTVVNSATTSAQAAVTITPQILASQRSVSQDWNYALNPGSLGASFAMLNISSGAPDFARNNGVKHIAVSKSNFLRFPAAALVSALRHNEIDRTKSVSSVITNTFNTGHLIGDIRRAYLADVDVGSVSGTELVSNSGNPFVNTTGWAGNQATLSVVGGRIRVAATLGAGQFMSGYVNLTGLQPGEPYVVSAKFTAGTITDARSGAYLTGPGSTNGTSAPLVSGVTGSYVQIADSDGSVWFNVLGTSAGVGSYYDIDFLSVKRLVADRSYKAQTANITGTLTKTQVAGASQLVAYSGFSAANYLREPYSADLDFGTGEWSASAWVNVPVTMPVSSFPVVGSELVTNGTFNDATGWGLNAGWTISGGVLNVNTASWTGGATFNFAAATGKYYKVTFDVSRVSGTLVVYVGENAANVTTSISGTFSAIVPAGVAPFRLNIGANAFVGTVDNVSVVEVGSSLISDRAYSSGPKINVGVNPAGFLTATAFDGTTTRTVTTTAAYNTGTWLKAEAVYTTDGTLAIRVNGVEVAATRGTPLLTLNNSNAPLTIGNSFAADAPFPGSIALLKFSATVPTAEQSQWMYEQEKQMFRDGAQVTLPDSGAIVDLTYDDATDKWIAVSATNESEWSGLVRTSVTASPAGSYTKTVAASGIQMHARSTTNPGVDINIPSYGLREELVNRSQAAARLARNMVAFDYVGGFTANTTTGATSITSVASLTYPVSYVGARISGAGIPANTTVVAVSGTTIYMSAAATATASGVQISFVDFTLPLGYEAREVLTAGLAKVEGATKDFTRLFDGFKETIRFGTAPGFNAAVQIQATRSAT